MSVGWVFTEMGRQPWLVFGMLKTEDGVSPGVSGVEILISLIAFTLLYGILAVVEFRLILKAVQKGPDDAPVPDAESGEVTHAATVY
jgi:cytochrome d ubiquinol oxidase subunit I